MNDQTYFNKSTSTIIKIWKEYFALHAAYLFSDISFILASDIGVASPLGCLSVWFCLAVQLMHGEY
jgi:hypothetical protein